MEDSGRNGFVLSEPALLWNGIDQRLSFGQITTWPDRVIVHGCPRRLLGVVLLTMKLLLSVVPKDFSPYPSPSS